MLRCECLTSLRCVCVSVFVSVCVSVFFLRACVYRALAQQLQCLSRFVLPHQSTAPTLDSIVQRVVLPNATAQSCASTSSSLSTGAGKHPTPNNKYQTPNTPPKQYSKPLMYFISMAGASTDQLKAAVRGPPGTPVVLTFRSHVIPPFFTTVNLL